MSLVSWKYIGYLETCAFCKRKLSFTDRLTSICMGTKEQLDIKLFVHSCIYMCHVYIQKRKKLRQKCLSLPCIEFGN